MTLISSREDLAFQDFNTQIPSDSSGTLGSNPQSQPSNSLLDDNELSRKVGGVFDVEAYSVYFDISTLQVCQRCIATFFPPYNAQFLAEVLEDKPDLYGPFWVPTTVIFTLFVSTTMSRTVEAYMKGVKGYTYEFTTLGTATGIVYTYALGFPLLFWAGIRYWAGITERTALEVVNIYGYSMTIWAAASLLCIPPSPWFRLVITFLSTVFSGFFILRNLYPMLATSPTPGKSKPMILLALGGHAILGIALWWGFLSVKRFDVILDDEGGAPVIPTLL